ncbi:MAG: hypothetical protein AAGC68_10495, partial [Verrucomicrobiota bacterium]
IRSAPTLYVDETNAQKPGFIENESGSAVSRIAVNLHPSEGDTTPFDPSTVFRDWGISLIDNIEDQPTTELTEEQLARLKSEEKEDKQKLWKWIVLAALLILIVESWLAGRRFSNSRFPGGSGASPAPSSAGTASSS